MKIILLDLNFTLVSNSKTKKRPFERQIEGETYRADLLEQLRGHNIILITARPDRYKEATLASLSDKTGWQPDEAYFNEDNVWPPASKKRALERYIFPEHGEPPGRYLAIESNPATRQMYGVFGITACRYDASELPKLLSLE